MEFKKEKKFCWKYAEVVTEFLDAHSTSRLFKDFKHPQLAYEVEVYGFL